MSGHGASSLTSQVDFTRVKPYGDTLNDGSVQLSFTLPVAAGPRAAEAARRYGELLGLKEVSVVYSRDLGVEYTFFVVYGKSVHAIDYTQVQVPVVEVTEMSFDDTNAFIRAQIGRKVVVVGACIGTDAHTVGIDAIMNMKGYHGHVGLERYPEMAAYNLGAQVPPEDLVAKAIQLKADAILASQLVTQKDSHLQNFTQLVNLLDAEGLRDQVVLICGGPRVTHLLAKEMGYDAGFGPGSHAGQVGAFIAQELARRLAAAPRRSP